VALQRAFVVAADEDQRLGSRKRRATCKAAGFELKKSDM